MNISCTKCGNNHDVPDSAVENKKIFFFCSKCGHKVIVDNRKSFTNSPNRGLPGISGLISVLPVALNRNNILCSMLYGFFATFVLLLLALIVRRNVTFFMRDIEISIILGSLIFMMLYFGYVILMYYISKITLYKLSNPHNSSVDWRFVNFDLKDDIPLLFVLTIGLSLVFGILISPIKIMKSVGVMYSGVLFPILYILGVLMILVILLFNFIPAFVSLKSRFPRETLTEMLDFLKREMVSFPAYIFVIRILSSFVFGFLSLVLILPLAAVGGSYLVSYHSEARNGLLAFAMKIMSGVGEVQGVVTLGGIFLLFFTVTVFLLVWSVYVCVNQALYTKAVYIMEKNPVHSIDHRAYLIALVVLSVFGANKGAAIIDLIKSATSFIPFLR